MNIDDLLAELGSKMGLPQLKLDQNKVCRLVFDKKYTVDIEASEDLKTVYVYSALCIIPPENKETLYQSLLEANLFGRGTGGAAFGIDLEMGEVLLSTQLDMDDVDYNKFVQVLESFVNHVEAWTQKIDSGDYARESAPASSIGKRPDDDDDSEENIDSGPPPGFIKA